MNKRFSTNQTRLNKKGVDESKLSLFDRNSNDLELFNLVDDELIKLSGSKIYYYKSYIDDSYYFSTTSDARRQLQGPKDCTRVE